ncbi:unnamed protein product [Blepharisma stoltei]|uniref:Uncharacterized protein n=1 Tax=Blepharisma stoltei TaxID=1481888 RepID=A0AAU9K2P6_9CILI|nr:unnamed protein product [Blepharisma stoltei]
MNKSKKADLSKSFSQSSLIPIRRHTKSRSDTIASTPSSILSKKFATPSPKKTSLSKQNTVSKFTLPAISIHRNPLSLYSSEELTHVIKSTWKPSIKPRLHDWSFKLSQPKTVSINQMEKYLINNQSKFSKTGSQFQMMQIH